MHALISGHGVLSSSKAYDNKSTSFYMERSGLSALGLHMERS